MQVKWSWCVVVCVCAAKDEGKLEKKGVGKVVLMYCILCVCTVLCVGGCEAHAFAAKGDWKLEKKGVSEAVLISSVCVRCVCVCVRVCVCVWQKTTGSWPRRVYTKQYWCFVLYVLVQQDTVEEEEEPLPAGWAMGRAPNGRQFFIDHNERRTTWVSALCCDLCVESSL